MYILTPAIQEQSLFGFYQESGIPLDPNNQWIQLANRIDWTCYEEYYAEMFPSHRGRPGLNFRIALGAYILQTYLHVSDRKLCQLIAENPYYQYFLGLEEFQHSCPFVSTFMVQVRKRFSAELVMQFNEMYLESAEPTSEHRNKKKSTKSNKTEAINMGTMIVDATCSPSNIRYPQDFSLLNESRVKLEEMIDYFHKTYHPWKKPRAYRRIARKDYLNLAKSKKRSAKKVRMQIRRDLENIKRDLGYIEAYLNAGYTMPKKYATLYETIKEVYAQQKYMYDNKTHRVEHRIVSLNQPYLRPIVRGKAKAPVEFGAKYDISVDEKGHARLEKISFEPYNESQVLIDIIERYKKRTGKYPERVLVDQIYRTRANRAFCNEHGIRMSGPKLGRPPKDGHKATKVEYQDNVDRIEVERIFSLDKHSYGAGLIMTKLEDTTLSAISMSIFVGNLFSTSFGSLFLLYLVDCGSEPASQHYIVLIG